MTGSSFQIGISRLRRSVLDGQTVHPAAAKKNPLAGPRSTESSPRAARRAPGLGRCQGLATRTRARRAQRRSAVVQFRGKVTVTQTAEQHLLCFRRYAVPIGQERGNRERVASGALCPRPGQPHAGQHGPGDGVEFTNGDAPGVRLGRDKG